jgi:hypothetical protein
MKEKLAMKVCRHYWGIAFWQSEQILFLLFYLWGIPEVSIEGTGIEGIPEVSIEGTGIEGIPEVSIVEGIPEVSIEGTGTEGTMFTFLAFVLARYIRFIKPA